MVQGQGLSSRAVMLLGWATALAMVVTVAADFLRRSIRTWPALCGLGLCCAAIGAVGWDGCRELTFAEMRPQINGHANRRFAINGSVAEMLQSIAELQRAAAEDSDEGRDAAAGLNLIRERSKR